MFGKLGDMMGRLHEMKQKAEEIKVILADTLIHVEGAGGDIKIVITGDRKIKDLSIAPGLQHAATAELQEQLVVTLNRAIAQADKLNEDEMKKAAGGIMPGL